MWDDWIETVPADVAAQASELRARLLAAGCGDAEDAVYSEFTQDIPQAARYRFLHQLWPLLIDRWREGVEGVPAADRLLTSGASRDDLIQLARSVAYETVFGMLYHLDDDNPGKAAADLPHWDLQEVDVGGEFTGRHVGALYEDLLGMDPSGREGQDLWSEPPAAT